MTRSILIAPALTLALAACGPEISGPPAFENEVRHSAVAQDRPFRATCQMQIQPPTPLGPGLISQVDAGECQALHLGKATLVSDKVINLIAGTQATQITFTAANGDVLRADGTGTNVMVAPGIVQFTANMTFVGGTGRFANASGQATINGRANLAQATSAMVMEGSVTY